ncbi:VanZ family protein [Carbonactinospora thermoautotrophica]|uniref:VanZ family protein n=1 Tax=Carbonactinospora thermoautotrophica TaxID=1469144 RepID=A0A132MKM7_9ACTN|nr:VanZ family protein [Carbonactinospora thermoautotrophica]KWW98422.1 VanZ family protein [Carbonactinospora thermoautotrophica]
MLAFAELVLRYYWPALLASLTAAVSLWRVLVRRGVVRKGAALGLLLSLAAVATVTIGLPSSFARPLVDPAGVGRCAEFALTDLTAVGVPRTVEDVVNTALLAPLGFFGVLVARRFRPVLGTGLLLAAFIEALQALLPPLGRSCTAGDVVMNMLGLLAGTAGGALWLSGTHLLREDAKDGHGPGAGAPGP